MNNNKLAETCNKLAYMFYYNDFENTKEMVMEVKKDGISLDKFKREMVKCYKQMPNSYMRDILACAVIITSEHTPYLFKGVGRSLAQHVRDTCHGSTKIRAFFEESGYEHWKQYMAKDMKTHKSFEEIIRTVSTRKYHGPIVYAYVKWIVKTKGIEA